MQLLRRHRRVDVGRRLDRFNDTGRFTGLQRLADLDVADEHEVAQHVLRGVGDADPYQASSPCFTHSWVACTSVAPETACVTPVIDRLNQSFAVAHERHLDNLRTEQLAAHVDLNRVAHLRRAAREPLRSTSAASAKRSAGDFAFTRSSDDLDANAGRRGRAASIRPMPCARHRAPARRGR